MARPRVLLNWAQSLDGRMAAPGGAPLRLSDEADLRRVHGLRATCDAILVGIGTVLADDPSLRVKPAYADGADPVRVVLDRRGRTPRDARVVDGTAPTVLIVGAAAGDLDALAARWPRADVVVVPDGPMGLDLGAALDALGARRLESVLVEGGGLVLRSFMQAGLADEITCYIAPVFVGPGAPTAWPESSGWGRSSRGGMAVQVVDAAPAGEGVLIRLRTSDAAAGR